ncbi:periplasmic heavy metal sensor [Desulfovibrio sp. TomC]|uniref:periplasmic heavy metal sensor n=1 Tax=Desulfovibrio sp. TomC TaxID=1562888 RepID=UPI0005747B0A|nr:periplasmic heavy metal sensor [Desulfovibrio sp. TomC]KHK00352.1 Zinc resistance-associated protein [Desulfovibrio sp. TomC]
MNTRKHLVGLALVLVALLGLSGLANAQMVGSGTMSGQGMMNGQGMMGGNMMTGLTPEKQAAVQKIHADFNAVTASLRQQLTSKQYELNAQIYSATPDDKKVQALTKEVSDMRAKLFEAQVALQGRLTKEGLPTMGGMGMMGSCMIGGNGMMGPGMMSM